MFRIFASILLGTAFGSTQFIHADRPSAKNARVAYVFGGDTAYLYEPSLYHELGSFVVCGGSSPASGAKVDHKRNLWVACTDNGTIEMYPPGASSPEITLSDNVNGTTYYVSDVAVDNAGDVYVSSLYAFGCGARCVTGPGHVDFWLADNVKNGANPSGTVADSNLNGEAYYLDTDSAGDTLFVDYYGCHGSTCNYAADAVANPRAPSASVTTFIPLGGLQLPGGIAVTSQPSPEVNIIDQKGGTLTSYGLPSLSLTASVDLVENAYHSCDPIYQAWNEHDTQVAIPDPVCKALWHGTGRPPGKWHPSLGPFFFLPDLVAYSPSDK